MSRTYNLKLTEKSKRANCKHELENKGRYYGKISYKCKWCTYEEFTDETKTSIRI